MTIIEFLLARIAEDEAPVYVLRPYECEPGCCAPAGYVGHECLICKTGVEYGGAVEGITQIAEEHAESIHRHSRVLAECAAKRAIVEEARYYIPELEHGDNGEGVFDMVLRALAAVHADHEDYDTAWSV